MSDHLPECPVYGHTLIDPGGMSWLPERKKSRIREANARACICPELRACEQRVRQEVNAPAYLCVACWHRQDGHTCERPERCMCRDCNYAAGLDAAREAVDRLASDMANWSSAETAAATDATPDLTVDQWMWAQRGVHRALAAIEALRLPPLPTAHYNPAAKDNRP